MFHKEAQPLLDINTQKPTDMKELPVQGPLGSTEPSDTFRLLQFA